MHGKVHLIIPMAGQGSRFSSNGFKLPKPLIQIHNKPFFYWATQSIRKYVCLASLSFIVLQEHIDNFHIDKEISLYFPEANIIILSELTGGAVESCLLGSRNINNKYPVIFNDCDQLFKSQSLYNICAETSIDTSDGLLLTFNSDHPKYSFVEKDIYGKIIRTAEKIAISKEAICGCYYFKNIDIFRDAATEYLNNCCYQEYFMSGLYNQLIKMGFHIQSIKTDFHIPFGIPSEFEDAKNLKEFKEFL